MWDNQRTVDVSDLDKIEKKKEGVIGDPNALGDCCRSVPGKKVVIGSDMVARVKKVVVKSVGSPFFVDLP